MEFSAFNVMKFPLPILTLSSPHLLSDASVLLHSGFGPFLVMVPLKGASKGTSSESSLDNLKRNCP